MGGPDRRKRGGRNKPVYAFEGRTVPASAALPTDYRVVSSDQDAQQLAAVILDEHRDKAVLVISSSKDGARFRPEEAAARLGEDAHVYLLATPTVAFDFERYMPEDCAIYGGAARTYPPGTAWTKNPRRSVVRTAYTEAEARDVLQLIADDVDNMIPLAYQQPQHSASGPGPAAEPLRTVVHGRVSSYLAPDAVLVALGEGKTARVELPRCGAFFDTSQLLPLGMAVAGTLDGGLMEIEGRNTPADAADYAVEGTIHLALVVSEKTVMLFPGLEVRHRSDAEPGAIITVLVELAGRADGKSWRLSTLAAPAPEDVEPALPFIEGGAPWLTWPTSTAVVEADTVVASEAALPMEAPALNLEETPQGPHAALALLDAARSMLGALIEDGDRLREENLHLSETVETLSEELDALHSHPAAGPTPAVSPQAQEIARLNARIAVMQRDKLEILRDQGRAIRDADQLATENSQLARVNERLREEVRTERERANRARQEGQRAAAEAPEDPTGPLFNDPVEQFRHEVYLEWAQRIPPASKVELPLAEYDLAPGFLESVEALQGVFRAKVVSVAVEVLTGLADRQPGRDMHRLRGGNARAPYLEDPILGTAWRVSLQAKAASARRMHFWRGADGRVVFATVGVHDETGI